MTAAQLRPGLLYFAYGCNMDPSTLARVIGFKPSEGWAALADGWRLAFDLVEEDGTTVASLRPALDCLVYGVVYRLPKEALSSLDEFEDAPERYRRVVLWVEPLGRRARQAALAYVGSAKSSVSAGRPESEYLDLLLRGAAAHRLPPKYVDWIRALARGAAPDCYQARPDAG